jgi:hypothetical protein
MDVSMANRVFAAIETLPGFPLFGQWISNFSSNESVILRQMGQ